MSLTKRVKLAPFDPIPYDAKAVRIAPGRVHLVTLHPDLNTIRYEIREIIFPFFTSLPWFFYWEDPSMRKRFPLDRFFARFWRGRPPLWFVRHLFRSAAELPLVP